MDTTNTIKIPKLSGNTKAWFQLTGSTAFKNVGAVAEVGYSSVGEPTTFKGETVLQGEIIDTTRGNVYVLQDAYFSYEFMPVDKPVTFQEYLLSPEFGASFPTADPHIAGRVWNNLGILTVSIG